MVAWLKALHHSNCWEGVQKSQHSDQSGLQIAPGAKGNLKVCRSCQNNSVIITAYKEQDFEACQHERTLEGVVPLLSGYFLGLKASYKQRLKRF